MDQSPDFTRYVKLPNNGENPYQWAQTQEVGDAKNLIEQVKLLHSTQIQNIQNAEVKLFGADGAEDHPSPLSIWHGYAELPATAEWQLKRGMISDLNELDLARTSQLVKVINTYRRLAKTAIEISESYPKDLTEISKFFPEEIASLQKIHAANAKKLEYLREREMHFKRLLIDIRKNLAEGKYPAKLSEPIGFLLKQLESPISDTTVEMPYIFQERSFDDVREALRPANDDMVTRNDKPPKKLAA